jgi:hypothetical protein
MFIFYKIKFIFYKIKFIFYKMYIFLNKIKKSLLLNLFN